MKEVCMSTLIQTDFDQEPVAARYSRNGSSENGLAQ